MTSRPSVTGILRLFVVPYELGTALKVSMERFGLRSLRDDNWSGKETKFLVLDSSSIRVFFRNKVKKKCIENEMYSQAHQLLDTTSKKSTRSDDRLSELL